MDLRAEPRNDLVSAMVAAIDNESLSNVETLMVAITIMVAGNETSTNLIGNTVVELLSNPDQLKILLDDPDLLPSAVDEANRLTAPIQFAFREATQETEIAGTVIPKGAIVALRERSCRGMQGGKTAPAIGHEAIGPGCLLHGQSLSR